MAERIVQVAGDARTLICNSGTCPLVTLRLEARGLIAQRVFARARSAYENPEG